jgi:hypothetical protein
MVIIKVRRTCRGRRMARRRILVRRVVSGVMGRAIGMMMTTVVAARNATVASAIVARLRRAERRASEGMMS